MASNRHTKTNEKKVKALRAAIPKHIVARIDQLALAGTKSQSIVTTIRKEFSYLLDTNMVNVIITPKIYDKQEEQPTARPKRAKKTQAKPATRKVGSAKARSIKPKKATRKSALVTAPRVQSACEKRAVNSCAEPVQAAFEVAPPVLAAANTEVLSAGIDVSAELTDLALKSKARLEQIEGGESEDGIMDREWLPTARAFQKTLVELHKVQTAVDQRPTLSLQIVQYVRSIISRDLLSGGREKLMFPQVADGSRTISEVVEAMPTYAALPPPSDQDSEYDVKD